MSRAVFDFSGKTYIVTGASSGMGQDVALRLALSGAKVLAVGRNKERLAKLKAQQESNIITATADVTVADALNNAMALFVNKSGQKFSGAVHAAGVAAFTPLKSHDEKMARQIMDVSFWAGMELLRLVTKSKYGEKNTATVLFSSAAAKSCDKGMFAYAAAKAALTAGMKAAAKEISGKGHRVNCLLPGWIDTPLTQNLGIFGESHETLSRHLLGAGKVDDVTDMVLFLLSDSAQWITGAEFAVDGGYLA